MSIREVLEEHLVQVSAVIDQYESAHISSQTYNQLEKAVNVLLEQNQKLLKASDEEMLLDKYCFFIFSFLVICFNTHLFDS